MVNTPFLVVFILVIATSEWTSKQRICIYKYRELVRETLKPLEKPSAFYSVKAESAASEEAVVT